MGGIRRGFGWALLGLGTVMALFTLMTGLFSPNVTTGVWVRALLGDILLFLLPGWLLLRSGMKARERALAEEGSPAAGEELARSSGNLRKWLGLVSIVFGGITCISALLMAVDGSGHGVGLLVLAATAGVLFYAGFRLTRTGEVLIDESLGEERVLAARESASTLGRSAQPAAKQVVSGLPPELIVPLASLLRKGKIPLDPKAAGLACVVCGIEAELKQVELTKNTGLLIVRQHETLSGRLCRPCIERIAWDYTSHNLVAGWWGLISFVVNLGAIPSNLIQRSGARSLAPPPKGATSPRLDTDALARLRPAGPAIARLLVEGKHPQVVYRTTAEKLGVTPGQVAAYAALIAVEASDAANG